MIKICRGHLWSSHRDCQLCCVTKHLTSLVGTFKSLRENLVRGGNEKCIYSDNIRRYVIYQMYLSSRVSIHVSLMTVTINIRRPMDHHLCPTFKEAVISGVPVARILDVTGRALVSEQKKVACARRHVHVA